MKQYLTIARAAPVLGITEKALRQRIFRGQIPHRRWGHRIIIDTDELDKFMTGLPGKTAEDAAHAVDTSG